jgi:hypothetical protein
VFIDDSHSPSQWTKFLKLKSQDKVQKLKTLVQSQEEDEEEKKTSWSWRKLVESVLGKANKKNIENKDRADSPDSYNLYDKKPDFKNAYGWSSALDGGDYSPLKIPNIGVFHVNLTAVCNQTSPYLFHLLKLINPNRCSLFVIFVLYL